MTEQKNSSKTTALAQALLLEQVEFFKKQLSIENSPIYFQQFIQLFMQHADEIKLCEVVDLEQLPNVLVVSILNSICATFYFYNYFFNFVLQFTF